MLTERKGVQIKLHCITIEDLVPEDHILRKLEAVVDFSFIYDEVRELYCEHDLSCDGGYGYQLAHARRDRQGDI